MRYLGALRGCGTLTSGHETVGRADYNFDGYLAGSNHVIGNGEIRMRPSILRGIFGRKDVQLQTDDGRLLHLIFSDKILSAGSDAANVDVGSGLPRPSDW